MATNQLSLLRQWTMLRLVPRAPAKISVRELCEHLRDADFIVTSRTIQRDLVELSTVFPLLADDREKPYGWSWQRDAASFDLPGLSIPEAITLTLVEQQLSKQLPPSALDALQPHFRSAARTLFAVGPTSESKSWLNKVRSVAPLQPLLPPAQDHQAQRTVYMALMKDLQLELHYKKRDAVSSTIYPCVHPLGVVQRGGIIYLVCTFASHRDVRTLALHRVQQAHLLYEPVRRPDNFNLDEFIASGELAYRTGGVIALRASFTRAAGEHLYETPLSDDQVLTVERERLVLTASVPATRTLVFWLCGFGAGVEVHEPAPLRAQMRDIAAEMLGRYA